MAKKTKSAAEAAAENKANVQEAPGTSTAKTPTVVAPSVVKGLTQGEKTAYLTSLQHRKDELKVSADPNDVNVRAHIEGLTLIEDSTILDIAIGEIACGTSALGLIISRNENNYAMLCAMAASRGIKLPDIKALPAPTKEQLAQAGIAGVDSQAALVILPVTKDDVSKEVLEQKKREVEIQKEKPETDPSKIKSDDMKKKAILYFLTSGQDAPHTKLSKCIDFYRACAIFNANKIEDKEEKETALNDAKNESRSATLTKIAELVGGCPVGLGFAGHSLRKFTKDTGSPISAFCLYRRNAPVTGKNAVDDQTVADIVRILIVWHCNNEINQYDAIIARNSKLLEKNKNDKLATAAINKAEEDKNICLGIISMVTAPNFDVVDGLIDNYNAAEDSKEYKLARRIVRNVMETYYPKLDIEKLDEETMLKNVRERAGVIVNLFRDPLARSAAYSETNIFEMKEKENTEGEEGQSKN